MSDEEQGKDWRAHVGQEPETAGIATDRARAREPGRGRDADTPGEIPALGWRDILVRMFWATSANRVLSTAGSVAFFSLLAVFPGIAAIVSLYGLFADANTISGHLILLSGILPTGVLNLVGDQIKLVASKGNDTLGSAFAISLVLALYSANSGVVALFDSLNVVYNEKEERHPVRLYATTFAFTLAAVVFAVLAPTGVVALPLVLKFVGLPSSTEWLLTAARWPVLLVTITGSLAVVYRYGPSRNGARWRWVTWGHPDGRAMAAHHLGHHAGAPALAHDVDHHMLVLEDPVPAGPPIDPHARLVRAHDPRPAQPGQDGRRRVVEGGLGAAEQGIERTFADGETEQVLEQAAEPLVADGVGEAQVERHGHHARPKGRALLHPVRDRRQGGAAAAGAASGVALYARHHGAHPRQLDPVVTAVEVVIRFAEVRAAVPASGSLGAHHLIGLRHQAAARRPCGPGCPCAARRAWTGRFGSASAPWTAARWNCPASSAAQAAAPGP